MSHVVVFIGRSGCGKGTQAQLLIDEMNKAASKPVLYIETGDRFREFIVKDNHTSALARLVNEEGRRQPDFLACAMWTEALIASLTGNEHVVLDGTPRSLLEVKILETALDFYKFTHKVVVHIDVSREWSKKHLESRGRADDKSAEKIAKRLDWFETDVMPALEYFQETPKFSYVKINGEQPIEVVHATIMNEVTPLIDTL